MPYKILFRGHPVTCDTAEEVAALLAVGSGSGPRSSRRAEGAANRDAENIDRAVKLLEAVASAGDQGIQADALAQSLGLRAGRGLGAVLPMVKRKLVEVGLDPDDVLQSERGANGRVWHAGPVLADALLRIGAAAPEAGGPPAEVATP